MIGWIAEGLIFFLLVAVIAGCIKDFVYKKRNGWFED